MKENTHTIYTCSMHSQIREDKPGICPKYGMKLIDADSISMSKSTDRSMSLKSYLSLVIIIGLILLTSLTLAYKDMLTGVFSLSSFISYFMIGFFLTFSGFKLMDIKGFAEGYSTYDLLARKWFGYGYIYPFIELFLGLMMILTPQSKPLLVSEFLIMVFSGIGVAIKLAKHEKFHCACLGTLDLFGNKEYGKV